MIKVENGNVNIHGERPLVLAELSTLVHTLHFGIFTDAQALSAEESREMILEAVEDGFKTEEEAKQMAMEMTKHLLEDFLGGIEKILKGMNE